jgi:hypothetical protein
MSEPEPPIDRERSPLRRLLSRVDRWASRPLTALIVIAADLAWVLSSVALGFPGRGERVFQSLVAALTLAMVFVIQHTQAREQAATQRKLDEILQALPGADHSLPSQQGDASERGAGEMRAIMPWRAGRCACRAGLLAIGQPGTRTSAPLAWVVGSFASAGMGPSCSASCDNAAQVPAAAGPVRPWWTSGGGVKVCRNGGARLIAGEEVLLPFRALS